MLRGAMHLSVGILDESRRGDFHVIIPDNQSRKIKKEKRMKMKWTRRIVASSLAIPTVLLFSIFSLKAEDAHKKHEAHHHGVHTAVNDKVRCAIDGMMMKASAMIKVEHDGKAYYFCNDAQAKVFKANPDRFLQTIPLGNLTFKFNVLTTDEYKEVMSYMGIAGMIKTDEIKAKTHYFSVYPMQEHEEIA